MKQSKIVWICDLCQTETGVMLDSDGNDVSPNNWVEIRTKIGVTKQVCPICTEEIADKYYCICSKEK